MAQKWGVICKDCKQGIDLDEEYIPPGGKKVEFAKPGWKGTVTCANCTKTNDYVAADLVLYDA